MDTFHVFPAFDEDFYRDYDCGDGNLDPFARCLHALHALRAGDSATALLTLAERDARGDLADRIGGEAESLLRSGLRADAERRLECAALPKFASVESSRDAYEEQRFRQRKPVQFCLSLGDAA